MVSLYYALVIGVENVEIGVENATFSTSQVQKSDNERPLSIFSTHFPYFFEDVEITRQISILFFSRIEVFVSTLVHYLFMVHYRNSIAKSEVTENVALFFSFKTTGKNRFWPCFANTKNFMKQQVKSLLFTGLFFIIKRQGEGKAKGTYKSLP